MSSEIKNESARKSRLYTVWKGIRGRCNNPNNDSYPLYGGRGIKLCDEWNDFLRFADWAYANGYDEDAPYGQCTLDRIDNNKGYSPDNCRWANATQQNLNQRDTELIAYNGKSMTICQWADYLGVSRVALINRKVRGWSVERLLSEPIGSYKQGNHCKKPVICIEMRRIFQSINEAAENVCAKPSNISVALSSPLKTSKGYHWAYLSDACGKSVDSFCEERLSMIAMAKSKEEEESRKRKAEQNARYARKKREKYIPKPRDYSYMKKAVVCIETGEIFESVDAAAKKVSAKATNISACCRGKAKTIKGYHWEYA